MVIAHNLDAVVSGTSHDVVGNVLSLSLDDGLTGGGFYGMVRPERITFADGRPLSIGLTGTWTQQEA